MTNINLPANPKFPHVPDGWPVVPDSACSGCPKADLADHGSCAYVKPVAAPSTDYRLAARKIAALPWIAHRMQIDADGVPGAYNDAYADSWQAYNAEKSFNFADSYSYEVVSVSGKEITCQADGNPLDILLYTWRERDSTGTKWVTGYERHGTPQAGDVMQFSGNSVLTYTCWPIITRIKSVDTGTNQIVFETDKAATAALSKYQIWNETTEEWEDDLSPVTVKCWHHAGNPALWHHIIRPEYLYGNQRTLTVQAADVPSDGLVVLSADAAVMHPGGFDPLSETWSLEGRRIDTSEWENISDRNSRLYVLPNGPSRMALKTTKPAEGTAAPGADLAATYDAFRTTYWEKTDGTKPGCRIVGYARCKWSIPDPTGSNYGAGDGKVPGSVADGVVTPGYVCLKRLMDEHSTPVDTNSDGYADSTTHSSVPASGVSRYPSNGHCLQYGCCDQFTPAEDHSDGAPFSYAYDAGKVLRELVGAANIRLLRLFPRVASFSAWQAGREKHASLAWHAGYFGIDTPNVIDDQIRRWRGYGLWGTDYYTYSDTNGNEYVALVQGGFDGVKFESVAEGSGLANPYSDTDGHFAALGTDFTGKRSQTEPGLSVFDREMERLGVAIERGTGELQPRGIAQTSVAVAEQDIIIPAIDLSVETKQTRTNGSFEWNEDGDGVLTLFPLRQERKDPVQIGTRTVHSVSSLGGGKVQITLENVQHTWSRINDGPEVGDSYDQKYTFSAGGGWPIMPKPLQSLESHYEEHNYAGCRSTGAWRGDAIGVGDSRYVIDSVTPYGGAAAATWGDVQHYTYDYLVPAIWTPSESNLALGTDPETYGNMEIQGVYNDSTSTALTAIDQIDRPAAIGAGEYWTDGHGVYVGAAISLRVEYKVLLADGVTYKDSGTVYTEYKTVPADLEMQTIIYSADWTTADAVAITIDGVAVTPTVDTSGTYVVLTYDLLQASQSTHIVLTFNREADPPEDYYSYDRNYLAYAKKMDQVVAYDDPAGALAALTAGAEITFWTTAAVMMPGATLEIVEKTQDPFAAVPDYTVEHGRGRFVIPGSYLADFSVACFKAKGVRLMDHRGIVPATVVDKLELMARGLQWVRCGMGPGKGGQYSLRKSLSERIYFDSQPGVPCDVTLKVDEGVVVDLDDDGATMNQLSITSVPGNDATPTLSVSLQLTSTSFGMPLPLLLLPDDTVIVEAKAEVSTSGLTRTHSESIYADYDCDGNEVYAGYFPDPSTSIESVDYAFIGFTGPRDFAVLSKISGADNGQTVIDITGAVAAMFASRSTGSYPYGFGIMISDEALPEGGDISALLPPEPQIRTKANCPGSPCFGYSTSEFVSTYETTLQWSNVSIGTVLIKVQYPGEEFTRQILLPRLPAMT